jgi:hypothetical protein
MFRRLLLVWKVEHNGYLTGVRFLRRSATETATFFRYTRPFVHVVEYTRLSAPCPTSVELISLVTVFTKPPFSVFTAAATSLHILLFDVKMEFSSLPLKWRWDTEKLGQNYRSTRLQVPYIKLRILENGRGEKGMWHFNHSILCEKANEQTWALNLSMYQITSFLFVIWAKISSFVVHFRPLLYHSSTWRSHILAFSINK